MSRRRFRSLPGAGACDDGRRNAPPGRVQGMSERKEADRRLIIALDLPTAGAAREVIRAIGPAGAFYKIGLGMLAGGGLDLARTLKHDLGKRVFLDLKLFDIGKTVENAVRGLSTLGVDFITVHGDPQVVRAAMNGKSGGRDGTPRILAVTILTSLDRADLDAAMIRPGDIRAITCERAARALAAGADGVIAGPQEAALIRALPEASGRLIVTPGVRPAGAQADDQKRIATPAEALVNGADHIVVGRPIWRADDPAAATSAILATLPPA